MYRNNTKRVKLNIDKISLLKGQGSLYLQLFNQLKRMILNSEIEPGEKLPTIREMAANIQVNSVTVINAYKMLEKEDLIEKKVGSGSYVKNQSEDYKSDIFDFTGRDSNIDIFPLNDISQSISYILDNDGADAFRYEGSQGYIKLQESLKDYLSCFNIKTKSELIQIVSGGQQALDIITKALISYGETVITEYPTYRGAVESFRSREARILQIDLEDDGLDIDNLKSKIMLRKPSFLYIMPFNQKPAGINYSLKKKQIILDLANEYNFYIVEDDLGSEVKLGREDNSTLKSMDSHDRVIYIKSFTPLYMPGLRLGCIVPPDALYNKFLEIKRTTDISTPGLLQRSFAHYLNNKNWEDYYRRVSNHLTEKISLTNRILKRDFSDLVEYKFNEKCPSFWLKLKKGSGRTLLNICRNYGLLVSPGESSGEEFSNYFRLSIKSIPLKNIENGLLKLKDALLKLYSTNEEKNIFL